MRWLIHFRLLGNQTLLDEALELSMAHSKDPVVGPLAQMVVAERTGNPLKWLESASAPAKAGLSAWSST